MLKQCAFVDLLLFLCFDKCHGYFEIYKPTVRILKEEFSVNEGLLTNVEASEVGAS